MNLDSGDLSLRGPQQAFNLHFERRVRVAAVARRLRRPPRGIGVAVQSAGQGGGASLATVGAHARPYARSRWSTLLIGRGTRRWTTRWLLSWAADRKMARSSFLNCRGSSSGRRRLCSGAPADAANSGGSRSGRQRLGLRKALEARRRAGYELGEVSYSG